MWCIHGHSHAGGGRTGPTCDQSSCPPSCSCASARSSTPSPSHHPRCAQQPAGLLRHRLQSRTSSSSTVRMLMATLLLVSCVLQGGLSAGSGGGGFGGDSTPAMFLCPITQDVMADPVVAADGWVFVSAVCLIPAISFFNRMLCVQRAHVTMSLVEPCCGGGWACFCTRPYVTHAFLLCTVLHVP